MTTQLLILGNGFDLQCGLKSSYNDFFRSAILYASVENYGTLQLKPGVSGFWEGLLLAHYKTFGQSGYNWCDIEDIIKTTLWNICFGFNEKQTTIRHGIWSKAVEIVRARGVYFEDRAFYKEVIKDYLLDYCVSFMCGLSAEQLKNPLPSLLKKLLTELHSLEKRFCKYLKMQLFNPQNNAINEPYVVNAMNLLNELVGLRDGQYSKIKEFIHKDYREVVEKTGSAGTRRYMKMCNVLNKGFPSLRLVHILSFNYTAIFDVLDTDSPCAYNNVHGKLCKNPCMESCESSNVIFGIDDTSIQAQSECPDLRLFSKTYRKMFDTSNPNNILPKDDGIPIEIKFYGHSLSEADYSYFQSIFDYYHIYDNSNVSLLFYYSEGYEQIDAIYRLINEYGSTMINQDQGKNLIHKLLLENRLKIIQLQ